MAIDAVDDAVMATLQGDATLAALAPGQVHRDLAPEGVAETGVYVVVEVQPERIVYEQGGIAHTISGYRVTAYDRSPVKTQAQAAADRVDALLTAALTIPGQTHMATIRIGRESASVDDGGVIWRHQVAEYEVWSDPS